MINKWININSKKSRDKIIIKVGKILIKIEVTDPDGTAFTGEEKRQFKRVKYSLSIKPLYPALNIYPLQTIDISEGGAHSISNKPIEANTKLILKLKLPHRIKSLEVPARVAWTKKVKTAGKKESRRFRIGLEFLYLNKKYQKLISKFTKKRFNSS